MMTIIGTVVTIVTTFSYCHKFYMREVAAKVVTMVVTVIV